jgi:hypothetical protein
MDHPWKPIFGAPLNQDVDVWVTDGVEEFRLGLPCRRTEDGWVLTKTKDRLPERLKLIFWRDLES